MVKCFKKKVPYRALLESNQVTFDRRTKAGRQTEGYGPIRIQDSWTWGQIVSWNKDAYFFPEKLASHFNREIKLLGTIVYN